MKQRGVSAETCRRYEIGLCRKGMFNGYIAMPIFWDDGADWLRVGYVGRWADEDSEAQGADRWKLPKDFPKQRIIFGHRQALEDAADAPAIIVVDDYLRRIKGFDCRVFPWHHYQRGLWIHFHRIQKAAGIHLPFSADEIRTMLDNAGQPLKAMILLGVNCVLFFVEFIERRFPIIQRPEIVDVPPNFLAPSAGSAMRRQRKIRVGFWTFCHLVAFREPGVFLDCLLDMARTLNTSCVGWGDADHRPDHIKLQSRQRLSKRLSESVFGGSQKR